MYVEKDTKHTLIAVAVVVIVVSSVLIGIYAVSGVRPPHTVVVSDSMQHGIGSNIGVIDTGDMVILRTKDSVDICPYVDGFVRGYSKFGNYGDVIIYDRGPDINPVIHRAILWLSYNGDGTWSAPILEKFKDSAGVPLWSCTYTSGPDTIQVHDVKALHGTLTLKKMGWEHNRSPTINLDRLVEVGSPDGYLTMGDNNPGFDQLTSISPTGLINYERINSVAWFEVPWMGAFKMMIDGNTVELSHYAPNTVPALTAVTVLFIFILIGISFLFDHRYYGKFRKEMYEDMDAPAPQFPVEDEKED